MSYEAWRATFQSSEQAARSAYKDAEAYRAAEEYQISLRQKIDSDLDRHKRWFTAACERLGEIQSALGNSVVGIEPVLIREMIDERDALAAHVDRLRKAMTIATEIHIAFAKRMALGANATSMRAVDKADALLVREAYHVPIGISCLARRDAISQSIGMKKAARFIEQKANSYDEEHGKTDTSTNHREYPGVGAEYYNDLMELADELRQQAKITLKEGAAA